MTGEQGDILLSIAIPTKNRQAYLTVLLDELLLSARSDFEVVIHDNSDDDQLARYVSGANDPRLKYHYAPGWRSVVDNCDGAIRQCSGLYVCMLGDDDGILLDESLDAVAQAQAEGADALLADVVLYVWPDLEHRRIRNLGGRLYLKPLSSSASLKDVAARTRRVVARSGALGLEGLPCVYQGFVSRAVLERLREQVGSCFPGPSPDMANAIGISSFLDRVGRSSKALVVAGHSHGSAAGRGTRKEHRGSIRGQTHLPADTADRWYPDIPYFWSGPTIYAQSLRSALARVGITEFGRPGIACLYAACLMFEPSYARETWRALGQSGHSRWATIPGMLWYAALIVLRRAGSLRNNLVVRFFPDRASLGAGSIAEAIRLVRDRQRSDLAASGPAG